MNRQCQCHFYHTRPTAYPQLIRYSIRSMKIFFISTYSMCVCMRCVSVRPKIQSSLADMDMHTHIDDGVQAQVAGLEQ